MVELEVMSSWKSRVSLLSCWNMIGCLTMLISGCFYVWYIRTIHDNQYWFTQIKEVEREISFRTEQGLYYSYYKILSNQSLTLEDAVASLTSDTSTENSVEPINIFYRFNIHPELFVSRLFRVYTTQIQKFIIGDDELDWDNLAKLHGESIPIRYYLSRPIFFYTYFVFALQAVHIFSMFYISWSPRSGNLSSYGKISKILNGSTWLSGLVAFSLAIVHRDHLTRIVHSVSLREQFATPVIFLQFALTGRFLGYSENSTNKSSVKTDLVFAFTIQMCNLLMTLSWQFSQFVLLLQSLVLTALATFNLISNEKVTLLLSSSNMAIFFGYYMLYFQPMVINSLVFSFNLVVILWMSAFKSVKDDILTRYVHSNLFIYIGVGIAQFFALLSTGNALNLLLKVMTGQEADNHIFRFVLTKLGFMDSSTDFELNLYNCLAVFQGLDYRFFQDLCQYFALPFALIYVCVEVVTVLFSLYKRCEKDVERSISKGDAIACNSSTGHHKHDKKVQKMRDDTEIASDSPEAQVIVCDFQTSDTKSELRQRKKKQPDDKKRIIPEPIACNLSCGEAHDQSDNTTETVKDDMVRRNASSRKPQNVSRQTQEDVNKEDASPTNLFHVGQFLIFGLLAISTARMKLLWTPYICILAGKCLTFQFSIFENQILLDKVTKTLRTESLFTCHRPIISSLVFKFIIPSLFVYYLYKSNVDIIKEELDELKEFYDPNTVELMEWINSDTKSSDSFAGSMQLMASVRLSTMRPISNHPHFEDIELRKKTRQIYKMYGHFTAKDVHQTLNSYNITHIILEDSICLISPTDLCSTTNVVDLSYGLIPKEFNSLTKNEKARLKSLNLKPNNEPLSFCKEIKRGRADTKKLFRKVFENPTFTIYHLL